MAEILPPDDFGLGLLSTAWELNFEINVISTGAEPLGLEDGKDMVMARYFNLAGPKQKSVSNTLPVLHRRSKVLMRMRLQQDLLSKQPSGQKRMEKMPLSSIALLIPD